jgi:hypothetical protein
MKKTKILLPLVTLITLSQVAHSLELPVVSRYSEAESAQVWVKSKADQVPAALMGRENVGNPTSSYSTLFPKTFLQESLFAVCYQDCNSKDIFRLKDGEIAESDKANWNVIEQANVYFWLNKYFNFLETNLNFRPNKHLRVLTNREIREDGKKLTNNAFFDPEDTSLTFLPANKNLLFKLMAGKINRSGFDPSVIAHEASHYFFQHLYPNSVNEEITGLNEGFADYIAHIFLDNPKIGMVMLQGRALRDASNLISSDKKVKTYEPGMESHDLGERVAYALWETRKLTQNKEEFDRLVIDAVIDLNSNPYHAIHDFKEKMLSRMVTLLDSSAMISATTLWDITFLGNASKLANKDFLTASIPAKSVFGIKMKEILPVEMAKAYGIEQVQERGFSYIKTVKISDTQFAVLAAKETETLTTPYWAAYDVTRGNLLGMYTIDGKLITDEMEIAEAKKIANMGIKAQRMLQDMKTNLTNFAQLAVGKGQLAVAYKIKSSTSKDIVLKLNGEEVPGKVIELELKRKVLVAVLGIPAIDKLTLYTAPVKIDAIPEIDDQTVVGYKIQLLDGSESEMILNQFDAKK